MLFIAFQIYKTMISVDQRFPLPVVVNKKAILMVGTNDTSLLPAPELGCEWVTVEIDQVVNPENLPVEVINAVA